MTPEEAEDRAMLEAARDRCRTLLERLRREAAELARPSRRVAGDVLAEGRAAYGRAAVAAEQLLQRLEETLADPP